MKIRKFFAITISMVALPLLFYECYDFMSFKERVAIRELCAKLRSGDKLQLNLIKQQGIRLYTFSLVSPEKTREWSEKTREIKEHFDRLESKDFSKMFFLAEGFNRESLALSISDGTLTQVVCHTKDGFAQY